MNTMSLILKNCLRYSTGEIKKVLEKLGEKFWIKYE